MHNECRLNLKAGSVGFKKHLTSVLCMKVASHGRHLGIDVRLRVLRLLGPTEGERAAQAPGLAVVRGLILLLLFRLVANLRRFLAFGDSTDMETHVTDKKWCIFIWQVSSNLLFDRLMFRVLYKPLSKK